MCHLCPPPPPHKLGKNNDKFTRLGKNEVYPPNLKAFWGESTHNLGFV